MKCKNSFAIIFFIFILLFPFVSSNEIKINQINKEKTLFLHDDVKYNCTLNGNEISSKEKIEVVKLDKKLSTNLDYTSYDFSNKIKSVSLKKLSKNKQNKYSLLPGDVLKCGDSCDVFSIGNKTYLNVSDNIVSTIIDFVIWNGENYVDLLYSIVECENPTENKWNYTGINYNFTGNEQFTFILNSTHEIFWDEMRYGANFYSISDMKLKYNFEVVEDTCWITEDNLSSCLRFDSFNYEQVYNNETMEYEDNLKTLYMNFNATNGWSNFNDTEIDPIVSKEDVGESSSSIPGWVNKLNFTFEINETRNYLVMAMSELAHNDIGTSAYGRVVLDGSTINYVSHESKDYDKTRFYISDFVNSIEEFTIGNHTLEIDYDTELSGETTYIKNARAIILPIYTFFNFEDLSSQNVGQNVNTTVLEGLFTINESGNYLVVSSLTFSSNNIADSQHIYLNYNGINVANQVYEPKDSTDIRSFSFHNVSYFSEGNYNISILSESTSTSGIVDDARLNIIKLDDYYDFFSAESLELDETSSSVYIDKLTMNFVPENESNYVFIVTADYSHSTTFDQTQVVFELDGIDYCNQVVEIKNTINPLDFIAFSCIVNKTIDTTNHIAKIKYKANMGTDAYIKNARITTFAESIMISNINQTNQTNQTNQSLSPSLENLNFDRINYYSNNDMTIFFDHLQGGNLTSNISILWFVNDVSILNVTYVDAISDTYNYTLDSIYYSIGDTIDVLIYAINSNSSSNNLTGTKTIYDEIDCYYNKEPRYDYLQNKLYFVCSTDLNAKCYSYLYEIYNGTLISVSPDLKSFNDYKNIEFFNSSNYGNFFSSSGKLIHPYFNVRDVIPLHNYTFVISCSEDETGFKFSEQIQLEIQDDYIEHAFSLSFFSIKNAITIVAVVFCILLILIIGRIIWINIES